MIFISVALQCSSDTDANFSLNNNNNNNNLAESQIYYTVER